MMQFWHKFVAAGLLVAILSLPLASLATCMPQSASAMHCPPDCPMMAEMNADGSQLALQSGDVKPCCTIKSSKPAPVTESKIVPPVFSVEAMSSVAEPVASSAVPATLAVDVSPPPIPDNQVRLCTFQI